MPFRLASVDHERVLVDADGGYHRITDVIADVISDSDDDRDDDVAGRSGLPDPAVLHRLDATLAERPAAGDFAEAFDAGRVDLPIPLPRNCFAVGLNYADHAAESSLELPENPLVFTKFPSCIVAGGHDIELNSEYADWEVELVVVIGTTCRDATPDDAWNHVYGLSVGQDISDRSLQFAAKPPHFDLGKSRDTYGPIGPMVVSVDAVEDPTDLSITCDVNGIREQDSRTSSMIFDVATIIAYLSSILTLAPGDVIFTGTPDGVGAAQQPPRFLRAGDTIVSTIGGVGTITNRCI